MNVNYIYWYSQFFYLSIKYFIYLKTIYHIYIKTVYFICYIYLNIYQICFVLTSPHLNLKICWINSNLIVRFLIRILPYIMDHLFLVLHHLLYILGNCSIDPIIIEKITIFLGQSTDKVFLWSLSPFGLNK